MFGNRGAVEKNRNIATLCRMCDHGCGIEVAVSDNRPTSLKGSKKHPYNRGWLCAKGRAALDLYFSPERLTDPLIRSNGELISTDWSHALDIASKKLLAIREQYGPQSLAIYNGEGTGHQEIKYYMKRFANVYGTPNLMSVGSLCNASRTMGEVLTFGGLTKPDIFNARCLIIWGGNPLISHEPFIPGEISRFKKRGGKLIVVDPRKTETASRADMHLPIQPGTDDILILNILHVICREQRWDKAFTGRWVKGFSRFLGLVTEDRFSPEMGAASTGISPAEVRRTVQAYVEAKPAGILTGNGLEHHANGVNTIRLLAILKAISGNLDVRGGDLFTPKPKIEDITTPLPEPSIPPIGAKRFPLFCQSRKEGHALCLPGAILEEKPYSIKAMIISGGNPSLEWPDSRKTKEALRKLEFLLVIDVVRSPDSHYADVVLPACTFLERDEHRVNAYLNLTYITLRRQVTEPIHGLPDQMIWVKLARRMGWSNYFPWQSCAEGIDSLLSPLGITCGDIASMGGAYRYGGRSFKKYEKDGFNTPSGKVEIYPVPLKDMGVDPSPICEGPARFHQPKGKFPLILTTGSNLLSYTHWQYRYIPRLRKMHPEPTVDIHPETALQYGILQDSIVEVVTLHGRIILKANLTQKIRPDTVHIPQGWDEGNVNELTGAEDADPISGFPNLKSIGCRIRLALEYLKADRPDLRTINHKEGK